MLVGKKFPQRGVAFEKVQSNPVSKGGWDNGQSTVQEKDFLFKIETQRQFFQSTDVCLDESTLPRPAVLI